MSKTWKDKYKYSRKEDKERPPPREIKGRNKRPLKSLEDLTDEDEFIFGL